MYRSRHAPYPNPAQHTTQKRQHHHHHQQQQQQHMNNYGNVQQQQQQAPMYNNSVQVNQNNQSINKFKVNNTKKTKQNAICQ
jgi:hypothetical protein